MAADHGVIIIIAVRHKITNKIAGAVLRGHRGLCSILTGIELVPSGGEIQRI